MSHASESSSGSSRSPSSSSPSMCSRTHRDCRCNQVQFFCAARAHVDPCVAGVPNGAAGSGVRVRVGAPRGHAQSPGPSCGRGHPASLLGFIGPTLLSSLDAHGTLHPVSQILLPGNSVAIAGSAGMLFRREKGAFLNRLCIRHHRLSLPTATAQAASRVTSFFLGGR